MADEPRDLGLEHLRVIRAVPRRRAKEIREIKARQAAVEDTFSFLVSTTTRMQHSLDRLADRLEWIDRRPALIDEPA